MTMITDERSIKNGNVKAYWELFDREFPKCFSFAYNFTKNSLAAEGVVKNTMMRLWCEHQEGAVGDDYQSLLLRLLREELSLYFASIKSNGGSEVRLKLNKRGGEGKMVTSQAIAEMPAKRREIFLLSRRDGLDNSQIAEKMNISVRTVEKHIQLAIKQLGDNAN